MISGEIHEQHVRLGNRPRDALPEEKVGCPLSLALLAIRVIRAIRGPDRELATNSQAAGHRHRESPDVT